MEKLVVGRWTTTGLDQALARLRREVDHAESDARFDIADVEAMLAAQSRDIPPEDRAR